MWTKFTGFITGTIGQTALGALIGVAAYNGCVALYNKGVAILEARKEAKA